jgi:hypothetical protein
MEEVAVSWRQQIHAGFRTGSLGETERGGEVNIKMDTS